MTTEEECEAIGVVWHPVTEGMLCPVPHDLEIFLRIRKCSGDAWVYYDRSAGFYNWGLPEFARNVSHWGVRREYIQSAPDFVQALLELKP